MNFPSALSAIFPFLGRQEQCARVRHSAFLLAFGHADQPGDLLHASLLVKQPYRGAGTSLRHLLLHQVLCIRHGSDLCQMRNAQHLVIAPMEAIFSATA